MKFELRNYQQDCITAVEADWSEGERSVIAVLATGAGKTIIASEIMRRAQGNCLLLADSRVIVSENAVKFNLLAESQGSNERAGVEMGDQRSNGERIIIGSTQSMVNRLDEFHREHFSAIILDECHRNSLGESATAVLDYFMPEDSRTKVLGLTATPWRTDNRELSEVFKKVSYEVSLIDLIKMGHLSPITVKSVPLKIDLRDLTKRSGDYDCTEVGEALDPILEEAVEMLKSSSEGRQKIMVFLPLVRIAEKFAALCNKAGMKAVAVSGEDRSALPEFEEGDARICCNAMLLSTGYDFPAVDCILVLRPTKSRALFTQICGRGTRKSDATGKKDLLLLDPLYLLDDHKLAGPACLSGADGDLSREMHDIMHDSDDEVDKPDQEMDLLELGALAEERVAESIERRAKEVRKKGLRLVSVVDYMDQLGELMDSDTGSSSHASTPPPSEAQITAIRAAGFDSDAITSRTEADRLLGCLKKRREQGLATPKQLRLLKKFKVSKPHKLSMREAGRIIDCRMRGDFRTQPRYQDNNKPNGAFGDLIRKGDKTGLTTQDGSEIAGVFAEKLRQSNIDPEQYATKADVIMALAKARIEIERQRGTMEESDDHILF